MLNNNRDSAEISAGDAAKAAGDFVVLMVCTANQCRSPLAEFIFRSRCEEFGLDWHVESSGIEARPGTAMHPFAAQTLADSGILVGEWSATRTTAAQAARADLILTATTAHRGAVIQLQPRALQKTFTLFQFARLVSNAEFPAEGRPSRANGGGDFLAVARAVRSRLQPANPGEEDLADPIGRPIAAFEETARLVQSASRQVLAPFATR
jgi:protein-tyrosine phosphatase